MPAFPEGRRPDGQLSGRRRPRPTRARHAGRAGSKARAAILRGEAVGTGAGPYRVAAANALGGVDDGRS